eukprot:SAG31_NODE_1201_length_9418_cov_3.410881_4_plen_108_part_00
MPVVVSSIRLPRAIAVALAQLIVERFRCWPRRRLYFQIFHSSPSRSIMTTHLSFASVAAERHLPASLRLLVIGMVMFSNMEQEQAQTKQAAETLIGKISRNIHRQVQ